MRRIGILILLLTLCGCLMSCAIEQTDRSKGSDMNKNANSATYLVDMNSTAAILNQAAEALEINPGFTKDIFSSGYVCENLGDITIYRTYVFERMHTNKNVILLYFKDQKRYEPMNLEGYEFLKIDTISQTNDSDILCVNFTDGNIPTGSEWVFKSFVSSLDYSVSKKQVIQVYHDVIEGVYGYSGLTMSEQQFAQCSILDHHTAVFTFESLRDENLPITIDGPEILIPQTFANGEPAVFLFRRTLCNLSAELIQQINHLEGIQSAKFVSVDTPAFTGTKLTILPEDGYTVSCKFNENDKELSFLDFRIFCKKY